MTDIYGHRLKAFSLRMEKPIREKLEEQAKVNGRTLTGEINHILYQAVIEKDRLQNSSLDRIEHKLDQLLENKS